MSGQDPMQSWRLANPGEHEDENDNSDLDRILDDPPLSSQVMGPPADQLQYDTIMAESAGTPEADRPEARLAHGERPDPTISNLRNFTEWWGYYVDDGPRKSNEKISDYGWRIKRARVNMGIEIRALRFPKSGLFDLNEVLSADKKYIRTEHPKAVQLHSEKIDSEHPNYDALYAANWRRNNSARQARNQERRAAALAHARQYVQSLGIDHQFPEPVEPNEAGDDFNTETAPARGTPKRKGIVPDDGWDADDDVSDDTKEAYNLQYPQFERQQCKECRRKAKGTCSYRTGKFPCTYCKQLGLRCVREKYTKIRRRKADGIAIPTWSLTPEGRAMIASSKSGSSEAVSKTKSTRPQRSRIGTGSSVPSGPSSVLGHPASREISAISNQQVKKIICSSCSSLGIASLCDGTRPCQNCRDSRSFCVYNEGQQFDLHPHLGVLDEGYQTSPGPSEDIYSASRHHRNTEHGASNMQNTWAVSSGDDEMDIDTPEHGSVDLMVHASPAPPPPIIPRTVRGNRILSYKRIPSSVWDDDRIETIGDEGSGYTPQTPEVTSGILFGLESQPPQIERAIANIGHVVERAVTRSMTGDSTQEHFNRSLQETQKRKAPIEEEGEEDEEDNNDYAAVNRRAFAGKTIKRPKNWGTKAKRQKKTEMGRQQPLTIRPIRQSAQELRDHYLGLHLRPVQRYDPPSRQARKGVDTLNPPSASVQAAFPEFQEWRPGGAIPYLHGPGPKSRDPPEEDQDCRESIPAWGEIGTPWPGETYICGKQPTKLCDHVLDNTSLVCESCHGEQTKKTAQRRWNVIERSKARHCHKCVATGKARPNQNTFTDRCYCIQQLTKSWICNSHYDMALRDMMLQFAVRDEELIRGRSFVGRLCLLCLEEERPETSMAWRCKNCRRDVLSSTGPQ